MKLIFIKTSNCVGVPMIYMICMVHKVWIKDPQKTDSDNFEDAKSEHFIGSILANLINVIGLFCNPGL